MKNKNYHLREIVKGDIEAIHKGLSNPEVTKYYDVHFETIQETKEQMEWYEQLKKEGTGIWWGIVGNKDQQFVGAAGFNNLDATHQKAEIGMWLNKEFWGLGILQQTMPLLFEYGFTILKLNRIEAFVQAENIKCKKALAKIDFLPEGTMRECEVKNGKKIDLDIYAILKTDWLISCE